MLRGAEAQGAGQQHAAQTRHGIGTCMHSTGAKQRHRRLASPTPFPREPCIGTLSTTRGGRRTAHGGALTPGWHPAATRACCDRGSMRSMGTLRPRAKHADGTRRGSRPWAVMRAFQRPQWLRRVCSADRDCRVVLAPRRLSCGVGPCRCRAALACHVSARTCPYSARTRPPPLLVSARPLATPQKCQRRGAWDDMFGQHPIWSRWRVQGHL